MKTKILFIISITLATVLYSSKVYSKPERRLIDKSNNPCFILSQKRFESDVVPIQQVKFYPNNLATYIWNKGIFNQDISIANNPRPGLELGNGTGRFLCFTTGLCISAKINGQLREAMASYHGEYSQGYINGIGGPALRDSTFRVYWIESSSTPYNNPDYAQWGNMVPYGAPYIDINNNNQFDPGIDKPGIKNAEQTVFVCLTDGFSEEHNIKEGFGGGTPPMMVQVQLTAWGYVIPGYEDVQFFQWVILNKNNFTWDSTFISIVADPDIITPLEDYIGCDTIRNMGYCYSQENKPPYGPNPPALGMDLLAGSINFNVIPPDTLGLTSFIYFNNPTGEGIPCENQPKGDPIGAYNMLQGIKNDGTPWYNPLTGLRTKFVYPGDPESGIGWSESRGSVLNCNGDSITPFNIITSNPPGDRKFVLSSGSENFTIDPGDTQKIVLAQFSARGSNNLNSVTQLMQISDFVQILYDSGFVIGVEPISSTVPKSYRLHQNYPNPFNPTTKIKFELPKSSFVKLVVYDILGREVIKLVNEKLTAGSYETEWGAQEFASGVYFYKLVANDFSETKKMLLIK